MQSQCLGHDSADPVHRVESGRWALEDRGDPAAPDLAQPLLRQRGQFLAVECDATANARADSMRVAEPQLVDRYDLPAAEVDLQAGDAQPPGSRHGRKLRLGSSRSRRPSPSRLNANAVSRMARPGKVTSHQSGVK